MYTHIKKRIRITDLKFDKKKREKKTPCFLLIFQPHPPPIHINYCCSLFFDPKISRLPNVYRKYYYKQGIDQILLRN